MRISSLITNKIQFHPGVIAQDIGRAGFIYFGGSKGFSLGRTVPTGLLINLSFNFPDAGKTGGGLFSKQVAALAIGRDKGVGCAGSENEHSKDCKLDFHSVGHLEICNLDSCRKLRATCNSSATWCNELQLRITLNCNQLQLISLE